MVEKSAGWWAQKGGLRGSERRELGREAQRSLIRIWTESDLGNETARMDDDDLYSLRAIRDLINRCAADG